MSNFFRISFFLITAFSPPFALFSQDTLTLSFHQSQNSLLTAEQNVLRPTYTPGAIAYQNSPIHLTAAPPINTPIKIDSIWYGDVYQWRGGRYSKAGTYRDTLFDMNGFDSVYYTLQLAVVHLVRRDKRITTCDNTFTFSNGYIINIPQQQSVETTLTYPCLKSPFCPDTLERNLISRGTKFQIEESVSLCVEDTFYWFGNKYFYQPGSGSYDIHPSVNRKATESEGCDTTYIMHIHWNQKPNEIYDYKYLCPGETLYFGTRIIDKPGTYYEMIPSDQPGQCAQRSRLEVFHPDIRRKKPFIVDTTYKDTSICRGDILTYDGVSLHPEKDSSYAFWYETSFGCDSVFMLHVHLNDIYNKTIFDTICNGESYTFGSEDITASGFYTNNDTSVNGCDSVVTLHLEVLPIFELDTTMYICDGSIKVYNDINGEHFLEPNHDYVFTYTSSTGCDSIVRIHTFRTPVYVSKKTVEICEGEIYTFNGRDLWETGDYYDTLLTVSQCDSIVGIRLLVSRITYDTVRAFVCGDDSFAVHPYHHVLPPAIVQTLVPTKRDQSCDSIRRTFIINKGTEYKITTSKTICKGDIYEWHGKFLDSADIYTDTIHIEDACDSIFTIELKLDSIPITKIDTTICPSDYVRFKDQNIIPEGVYYDTFPAQFCDSIIELTIHHFPSYNDTIYDTICANQTYVFGNRIVNQDSTYTDYFISRNGCDSLITLCLHVNPTILVEYTDTGCFGTPYTKLGNLLLTHSGDYSYTTPSLLTGCDSTTRLNLLYKNKIETTEYIYFCESDSLKWNDTLLKTPGSYTKIFPTSYGCDSFHTIIISQLIPLHIFDSVYMCSNDDYIFHGKHINRDSDYLDTTFSSRGCDSVIHHLKLTVYPHKEKEVRVTVCPSDNKYITPAGHVVLLPANQNKFVYKDTFHIKYKRWWCDSIVTYYIDKNQSIQIDTTATICSNEEFFWRGNTFSQPGDYQDKKLTPAGCDSIFVLHLFQNPTKDTIIEVSICPSDSVYFKGAWHHTADTILDTLTTTNLCDSVVELHIFVNPIYSPLDIDTICEGESIFFNGRLVYQDSTYVDSMTTINGCDSIATLKLTVFPLLTKYIADTICQGEEYLKLTDTILKTTGVYTQTTQSVQYGCDSTTTIHLYVAPNIQEHRYINVCGNETFTFHDNTLPDTTFSAYDSTYIRHYTATNGCDSTLFIHITKRKNFYNTKYDTIENGDIYYFHNRWLVSSGTYFDSLTTIYGCDSIYELHLTVNKPQTMDTIINHFCDDNFGSVTLLNGKELTITNETIFNDTTYTADGLIDHVRTYIANIGSVYAIEEHITLCQSDIYPWRKQRIDGANGSKTYYDTVNAISNLYCDSIFSLVVHVNPIYTRTKDTTVCPSDVLYLYGQRIDSEGDYSFNLITQASCDCTVTWNVHYYEEKYTPIETTICQGENVFFKGAYRYEQNDYYDTLATTNGCDSVIYLKLVVHPTFHDSVVDYICSPESTYNIREGLQITLPPHSNHIVYNDTFQSQHSCDSIITYSIYQRSTYHSVFHDAICENKIYEWRHNTYQNPGIYYDTTTASNNCDSIFELNLAHNNVDTISIDTTICEGDWIYLGNEKISEEKTYNVTLTSKVNGCDSVVELTLHHHPTFKTEIDTAICKGDVYKFGSSSLYQNGDYYLYLHSQNGCDSIVHLHLSVLKPFDTIPVTLCGNKTFSLPSDPTKIIFDPSNNDSYIYNDTAETGYGCKHVTTYICDVKNNYLHTEYKYTCNNDPVDWRGRTLDRSDIFYDSLKTVTYGCDSVFMIDLKMNYHIENEIDTFICPTDYIIFGDQVITEEGTYTAIFPTTLSCDSIVTLNVHFYNDTTVNLYESICDNQHFWFVNTYLNEPGTYVAILRTTNGCDSTVVLHLVRNQTYERNVNIVTCPKPQIIINTSHGSTAVPPPYVYVDSVPTVDGCDSIITYIISIDPSYVLSETITVCKGQEYVWRNRVLTLPGIYRDTLSTNEFECDSIYEIVFNNYPTYYNTIHDTIKCTTKPYIWRDRLLTEPGYYSDSMITSSGCDSVFELFLEVCPAYLFRTRDTICEASPINFRGRLINKTGTYYDSLKTVKPGCNCDSVYMLELVSIPTPHLIKYDTICYGDSLFLQNKYQKTSGLYFDSVFSPTEYTCKTTETHLFVFKPEHIYFASLQITDFCANDSFFYIHSDNPIITPKYYFLQFEPKAKQKGFLDVQYGKYKQTITIDIPQYATHTHITPDIYNLRLDIKYMRCSFDTAHYDLSFTAHYPASILNQTRDGIIVSRLLSQTGGFKYDNYRWFVNDKEVFGANGFILAPVEYNVGDLVQVGIIRRGETLNITSCPLQVQNLANLINKSQTDHNTIQVNPTLIPISNFETYISSTENGTFHIYDPLGRIIQSGIFFNSAPKRVDLPPVAGCYVIKIHTSLTDKMVKVIVQ